MAISGPFAARVLKSAIGVILREDSPLGEGEITRRVIANNQSSIPRRFQEFQGIVRRALAIVRSGTEVMFSSGGAIPIRDLTVDPSIMAGEAAIRYRALAVITDQNGATVRTMATVDSDVPLTFEQVRRQLEDDIEGHASPRTSVRASIAKLHDTDTLDITLVSVGKRG